MVGLLSGCSNNLCGPHWSWLLIRCPVCPSLPLPGLLPFPCVLVQDAGSDEDDDEEDDDEYEVGDKRPKASDGGRPAKRR